jgi:hypothetical protein
VAGISEREQDGESDQRAHTLDPLRHRGSIIDPGHPSQRLGIDSIILASTPEGSTPGSLSATAFPSPAHIRLRGMPPKTSRRALPVAASFCSSDLLPAWSGTQCLLDRSAGSRPIVSFCSETFPICFSAALPSFFVADLLYPCASSTSINWGDNSIRRRPAFSSHLIPSATVPKARRSNQEIGTPPGDT